MRCRFQNSRWLSAMILAAVVAGCQPRAEWASNRAKPVATVDGYFQIDEARLEFVDGYVSVDYEPLEWHRYELICHLSHDPFSEEERDNLLRGRWTDLNHQSIPPGFPGPRANGDGERISPSVSISIGRWPTAALPNMEDATFGLNYRHFPTDYDSSGFRLDRDEVEMCEIDAGKQVAIRLHTKGKTEIDGRKLEWDIRFEGAIYEDTWPMREITRDRPSASRRFSPEDGRRTSA